MFKIITLPALIDVVVPNGWETMTDIEKQAYINEWEDKAIFKRILIADKE